MRNLRMSKTYVQDKTQQGLLKYWSSNRSTIKEKKQTKNSISGDSDPNNLEQLSDSISTNVNVKKRKAPVKEKTREETSSPPPKRMYETPELHKSSSSGNLQTNSNTNHIQSNYSPHVNPTWMVEMEQRLENNLTMNLTENLRSIIDESMNKAIEKVTASVNKIIETNPIVQSHSKALSEIQTASKKSQNKMNIMSKEHEELKAKLISIENKALENCLVFKGITEGEYEKEGETRRKIQETLQNMISSNTAEAKDAKRIANNLEIRKCRRLGKYLKDRSRPISVDFLRKEDADFIMDNKTELPEGIYADREYSQDTERKRKLLRPILRAARMNKDFKGRCKLEKDTLVLRGKRYTVNTIDQLPNCLNTIDITSKSNDKTFGYFGELNPLSNFHPAPFELHDQEYHCSEQYIQEAKAKYFNDDETYKKLRNTKTGLECKIISKQTKNFNGKRWEQVAKEMCKPGIKKKFQENRKPRDMLLNYTRDKLIVECAKDTLWGSGVPLEHEQCLDRSIWKGTGPKKQGIMGEILEEIRSELVCVPTVYPIQQGKSRPPCINPEAQASYNQTHMNHNYDSNSWSISSNSTNTLPPPAHAAGPTTSADHTGT